MTDAAQFISQVGFPIFVAVWMLYKTSQDSQATTQAINELKVVIQKLSDEIAHHDFKEGSVDA